MLNTLLGWHLFKQTNANFDTIVFEVSVGAGSSATPKSVKRTLSDSINGSNNVSRLIGGDNFFVTGIYSICEPGKVSIDILPDNNTSNKISILAFKPKSIPMSIPKLLETGVSIDFFNSEAQSNDVTIVLEGFWIPEPQTAIFTDLAGTLFRTLNNIDNQTLQINRILIPMSRKIDITNQLLINPKSYSADDLNRISPPVPYPPSTEDKRGITRMCGTGIKDEEPEDGE